MAICNPLPDALWVYGPEGQVVHSAYRSAVVHLQQSVVGPASGYGYPPEGAAGGGPN